MKPTFQTPSQRSNRPGRAKKSRRPTRARVECLADALGRVTLMPVGGSDERPIMRGQSSEPIELRPGISARQAARIAEVEQWAWRRVRSLRAFYTHVTVYLVANFVLLLIDVSTLGEPWFYKPLLAWGLVLGLHAAQAYEMLPWLSHDWEQRKVRELMERRLGE
jgi:2TM domain-containing protein